MRIYKLLSGVVFMVGRFLIYDVTFQNLKIKIRRDFLMIGYAYQDRVALSVFRFRSTFLFSRCDFFAKTFCTLIFKTPRTVFVDQTKIFNYNTFYFKDFLVLFTIAELFFDFYSGRFLSIFWHQTPFKLPHTAPTPHLKYSTTPL